MVNINSVPEEVTDKHYYRNYIALWIIGTINNFFYVVVGSAAKDLAKQFDAEDYVGAITWATSATGTFCRLIAVAMQKVPYWQRVAINTACMAGGTIIVAYAPNFGVLLAGILLIGTSSTFGESVFLGYMRLYPSKIVGGWSSGTGMAGVGGAAIYLLLSTATELSSKYIFLVLLPLCVIYYLTYAFMLKRPPTYYNATTDDPALTAKADREHLVAPSDSASSHVHSAVSSSVMKDHTRTDSSDGVVYREFIDYPQDQPDIVTSSDRNDLITDSEGKGKGENEGVAAPVGETRWQRGWRCVKLVNYLSIQMGLVYYFEYIVSQGSAASAEPEGSDESSDFWLANSYKILAFCYQFGVLISRSSLRWVRIYKVEWLTVLQGLNVVLWILQDKYHFMPLWLQFTAMVYVGLLGGASYVNVFHLLLEKPDIPTVDRELCVNLAAIYMNFGIIFAGVTSIFLAKVVV